MNLLKRFVSRAFRLETDAELAEAVAATANEVIRERDMENAALRAEIENLKMEFGYGKKYG